MASFSPWSFNTEQLRDKQPTDAQNTRTFSALTQNH